jgi:hypothetical protein
MLVAPALWSGGTGIVGVGFDLGLVFEGMELGADVGEGKLE